MVWGEEFWRQEFLWPVLFIIILALIKYMAQVTTVSGAAVESYPTESIYPNTSASGDILVVPENASNYVKQAVSDYLPNSSLTFIGISNISEAERFYRNRNGSGIYAGVQFSRLYDDYTIRTSFVGSASPTDSLNAAEDCRPDSPECPSKLYIHNGFLALQWALNCAILKEKNLSLPIITLQQMPKQSFIPDSSFLRQFAPVYYVYTYSFFVQFLVVALVHEKQSRHKETLRIMGMKDSAFWLSWALLYLMIIMTVSAIAVIFAALTTFFRPQSNMIIFFIMLTLYGLSIINIAFVLTPFLNSIQVAGPVSVLATTVVSTLFVAVSLTTTYDANGTPSSLLPLPVQLLLCLLSPTALSIAIERAIYLDVAQIYLTWSSLYIGDFPLYIPIVMLAVDSVLYFLLAVWLDRVVPGEYGKNQPLCYCFHPRYWTSRLRYGTGGRRLSEDAVFDCENSCPHIEPVPEEIKSLNKLQLFNIKKTFIVSSKPVEAVKGITLDIYENEITCLLGHNGAGKTSLMNMLTGLTPPTSGTALIYGLDIRDTFDMRELRKITGVCPQYDVLVDNMTCREHLQLYAALRGIKDENIAKEIEKILKEVDLVDKTDSPTKTLSGGQKRKLSVGIAFIGNPKVVFLDEPSAGMDPKSRRHLWSLLKNKKYGRVILLTTHFMDEADILADRKAIVSKGRLRCCGSSIYLKTKFGIGYNLNLTVNTKTYRSREVQYIVTENVPGAVLAHSHGMEVCFSLPLEQSSKFAELFRKLEEPSFGATRAALLGIMGYGISMTTLEEVFLQLAEIAESEAAEVTDLRGLGVTSSHRMKNSTSAAKSKPPLPRLPQVLEQYDSSLKPSEFHMFLALSKVRLLISMRDKMATFSRVVLPVILILISNVVFKSGTIQYNPPVSTIELTAVNVFQGFGGVFAYTNLTDYAMGIDGSHIANITGLTAVYLNDSSHLEADQSYHFGLQLTLEGTGPLSVLVLYNDTWIHSLPMLVNLMCNLILHDGGFDINIGTSSKPWGSIAPIYVFNGAIFTFALMVGFALIFLPSSFAQTAVVDRVSKAKSQLRIAGLSPKLYWLSTCAVDWAQYIFIGFILLISFEVFQLRPLIEPGALIATSIFLILYLPVYMLALYIFSYAFDIPSSSQGLLQTMCILLNIVFFVPIGMTAMVGDDYTRRLADTLHLVFSFINPFYSASGFFMYLLKFDVKQSYSQQSEDPVIRIKSYFLWENNLLPIFLAAFIWLPILVFLLWTVDSINSGRSFKSQVTRHAVEAPSNHFDIEQEDEDVAEEREKVQKGGSFLSHEPVLKVKGLRKVFYRPMAEKSQAKRMIAVKNLSFQVMPGEVLGLLGPNGAGKSTTMNMLTAEITPDAGVVRTGSTDIHQNLSEAYRQLGYCPQFDAVWSNISIREHLNTYSVVRGYHPVMVPAVTAYFIELLQLTEHADKRAGTLSGGTKRKLSFAMAMLGDPRVVLLDEPSTGMDPQSKRVFWDAIKHSFEGSERGAILTTHYMEEADALCHRIGIMINGQLECLGTTQHLKTRFGHGYQLEIKLASMKEAVLVTEIDKLHDFIFRYFPSSIILEQFGPRVAYKIAANEVSSLAKSFEILELAKKEVDIGEYNFSQATLEQVFLEFAKYQTEIVNTSVEQNHMSHEVARSRMVSAMHSRINSSSKLTYQQEDLSQIEQELKSAVENYVAGIENMAKSSLHQKVLQPDKYVEMYADKREGAKNLTKVGMSSESDEIESATYRPVDMLSSPLSTINAAESSIKPAIKSSFSYAGSMSRPPKKDGDKSTVKFDTIAQPNLTSPSSSLRWKRILLKVPREAFHPNIANNVRRLTDMKDVRRLTQIEDVGPQTGTRETSKTDFDDAKSRLSSDSETDVKGNTVG